MARKVFLTTLCLLYGLMAVEHAMTNSGGPPIDHAGAPGQSNCTACHSGTVNSGPATRTLVFNGNPSLTSYTPGQTYTAVLTISQSGISMFGFQMVARSASNANVGTFIATNPNETQISSGHLQHTGGGINATTTGTKSWSFSWTAPAVGTGTVNFYVATNAADGTGGTGGDAIYTNVFTLTEAAAAPSVNTATVTQSAVCRGGSITVNFTTSANFNAGNTFTVQLSDAAGSFANPTNIGSLNAIAPAPITAQTPIAATGGSGYRVRVVASNPASTGTQSSPFTITVPAAAPTLSFDGRTLTATGTGSVFWSFNGNPISGATGNSYVPTQAGNYLAGIENNGCSPSMSTSITVTAGFTSITSLPQPAYCEATPLEFNFTNFGSFNSGNQFTTVVIDANNQISNLQSIVSGNQVTAIMPIGLTGQGLRFRIQSSNPVAISDWSNPFTYNPIPSAPTLSAQGFLLTATGSGNIRWYRNQVLIPNATGNTYLATQNGTYEASAVVNNCSSLFSNAIEITTVSVSELKTNSFAVYPNPFADELHFESDESGHFWLINLQGQRLYWVALEKGNHRIELRQLPPSVYLMGWETANGVEYRRLLKQ